MTRITDNRKEWFDKELERIFKADAAHIKELSIESMKRSPNLKRLPITEAHQRNKNLLKTECI